MNAPMPPPARRTPPPARQQPSAPPSARQPPAQPAVPQPARPANSTTTQPVRQPGTIAPGQPVRAPRAVPAAAPRQGLAKPMSAPPAPVSPPGGPGPAGGPAQRENPTARARRSRAITPLRIGRHHAPEAALERLQLAGTFGLRLGRDSDGQPVAITLFHPDPWSVTLVGGMWAAKLLAFRALRFGARVLVSVGSSAGWSELGQAATGRTDRIVVAAPGSPVGVTASADTPVLLLWDADTPPVPGEPAAWQTRLTLTRRLTPDRVGAITGADMLLMQRLTPNETSVVVPALRLAPGPAQQLSMLGKDMLAVLTRRNAQYVWLSGDDPVERDRIGQPGRY